MGDNGMITPWQQALETMGALWDQWCLGVVRAFTDAMRVVVDTWQSGVEGIAGWILEQSASGSMIGKAFNFFSGVDMGETQIQAEQQRLEQIRLTQNRLQKMKAEQAGGKGNQELLKREIKDAEAYLNKLRMLPADVLAFAKDDVRQNIGSVAAELKKYIAELDRDAEARARNSEPQLPNWQKKRDDAQKALDALVGQAKQEKDFRDAWDQLHAALNAGANAPGVAGGGKDGNGVKGMLETKSLGATFSAAAAIAMGRGGGPGGNPQVQAIREAAEVAKKQRAELIQAENERRRAEDDMRIALDEIARNTKKFVAKAGP